MKHFAIWLAASALLAACSNEQSAEQPAMPEPAANTMETITDTESMPSVSDVQDMLNLDAIFAMPEGMEGDNDQYVVRKAPQVVAFSGVMPGMTVVEMEAGGGAYTELLSRIVGSGGKVYMQNPAEFDSFVKEDVDARLADNRLTNVENIKTPFDAMTVGDAEADVVTWFLGPHEIWYTPEGASPGVFGDPQGSFNEISRVLKTGGEFIALDHQAPDGAPATTGGETHRIDKAIVIELANKAGLELIDESDLLANPDDDKSVMVFDESVRRKTDRFLLKFRKTG